MSVDQQQASVKVQARAALDRLDRDAAWFVLGALTESAPEDFLKAVRLYQTVLGPQ